MTEFRTAMLKLIEELESNATNAKDFAALEQLVLKITQAIGRTAMQELSPEVLRKAEDQPKKMCNLPK
jgi:hypothetical protein